MKSTNSTTKEPRHTLSLGQYKKQLIIALNAAILLILVGGTTAYAAMSNTVKLTVDGETTTFRTFDDNVEDVLQGRGVEITDYDAVSPALTSTDIDEIEVRKAEVKTRTSVAALEFDTETRQSDSMAKGTQKVLRAGVDGKQKKTFNYYVLDGKVVGKEFVKSKVISQPKDAIVAVGTKSVSRSFDRAPITGSGINWEAIAQCESGGNWSINTGNGYYGGLQFSLSTWQSVGGTGLPSDASKAEQIYRAEILAARAGLGQWGCGHLG